MKEEGMKKLLLASAFVLGAVVSVQAATVQVVLLGVNAEAASVARPSSMTSYASVLSNMLALSKKSDVLVIGGGKDELDAVTTFWRQIGENLSLSITFVHGVEAIKNQPFSQFGLIAVASSEAGTPAGGLTQGENDAFVERRADLETFLNSGGALLGFSQRGFTNPYRYLPTRGAGGGHGGQETTDITPTGDGAALGMTDALDGCCWREEYDALPFNVLATNAATGKPVAVGYVIFLDHICDQFSPTAIVGTEGDDILIGTAKDDILIGLGGNDVLKGLSGNDVLCGGVGNDDLYGGRGADFLDGGDGDDMLKGQAGKDTLFGGAGEDLLHGNRGNDYLHGGEGTDVLRGGEGDDELAGGDGNDILWGEEGNDILNGGTGFDHLSGQKGRNRCIHGEIESRCNQ